MNTRPVPRSRRECHGPARRRQRGRARFGQLSEQWFRFAMIRRRPDGVRLAHQLSFRRGQHQDALALLILDDDLARRGGCQIDFDGVGQNLDHVAQAAHPADGRLQARLAFGVAEKHVPGIERRGQIVTACSAG